MIYVNEFKDEEFTSKDALSVNFKNIDSRNASGFLKKRRDSLERVRADPGDEGREHDRRKKSHLNEAFIANESKEFESQIFESNHDS